MSDTDTLDTPRVRARSRRSLDLTPAPVPSETPGGPSNIEASMAILRAKAEEVIAQNKAMNAAKSAADKAQKELAALCAEHEIPDFTLKVGNDTYEVGTFTDTAVEPDVNLLFKAVELDEFMKLVKTTQGAVKDYGGQLLLNEVIRPVTKEPAFKVRKRKGA